MQDAGGKEDADLREDDVLLGWCEWRVDSLDTVSLLENSLLSAGYAGLLAAGLSEKSVHRLHPLPVGTRRGRTGKYDSCCVPLKLVSRP